MRPLLVGEANPYGGPPSNALIPDPEYCAGWNLCHKILQLTESEYYERFDRVNLCHRDWKIKEARERASAYRVADLPDRIVLLGAKVTRAFGLEFLPFTLAEQASPHSVYRGYRYVILPHPSGLSRAWHEPAAFERARAVLREAGVL